ncbi:MAG: hypothetical protein U1E45_06140 [Geminicoccaceae bacterium]
MSCKARRSALLVAAAALTMLAAGPALAQATTSRVSLGPGGVQANGGSWGDQIGTSSPPRYVTFTSNATNLVADRTSGVADIFYTDLRIGRTLLVSRAWNGRAPSGPSFGSAMTPDGRYVAFASLADNLIRGDGNGKFDIFVRDMRTGKTERVSLASTGAEANDHSIGPAISADGRYVAFYSIASNLVQGDTNEWVDVFVRDRLLKTTIRASVGPGGVQAVPGRARFSIDVPVAISADGRFVGYVSDAANLAPGDTNGKVDAFVRDLVEERTELVSRGNGKLANAPSNYVSLSANGRYVAFASAASNLVAKDTNGVADIFVRDRKTRTTRRVNLGPGAVQANGFSDAPTISPDGSKIAYVSSATNLVANDSNGAFDVFTSSTIEPLTVRDSVAADGQQANGHSAGRPALTARGRFVIFVSYATNLVPGDTNGLPDVFLHAGADEPPPH